MRLSSLPPLRAFGTLALLLSALSTQAAFDAFLKIEGVPGESSDTHHASWIQVESLHFGLSAPSALAPTQVSPLTLSKRIDKASPLLAKACATGQHFAKVKLELVRTGPQRTRFYHITLEDVLVSGLSAAGAGADDSLPETIQLLAARWSWSYTEFELDGRRLQDHGFHWDQMQNAGNGSVTPALSASGTQASDGQMILSFSAKPGVSYRILGGTDLNGVFSELQRLESVEGGDTVVTLPAVGPTRFFLVEELP
jgi:type VI secretion system secreted protein Hcp